MRQNNQKLINVAFHKIILSILVSQYLSYSYISQSMTADISSFSTDQAWDFFSLSVLSSKRPSLIPLLAKSEIIGFLPSPMMKMFVVLVANELF